MAETGEKPKWLLELENRKRKPRLAHEAGAGAPCTICNAACPGLDLHFWRKICKNCKCSRDDHDVEDDEFPQFDLLFGPSKKPKRKPIILRVNNGKQHEAETAFEWVPPDTTKELATDYMKALPMEKLPIKGSAGAALRRQQLQKQLPLHDIDHKVCNELSEQEKKQFEKYLENIKKYVGQGKVTKILSARPFDRMLMTPANATDMQRFSPQHKPVVPSATVQLRTPSSFTPKSPYKKSTPDTQKLNTSVPQSETIGHQTIDRQIPASEMYNIIGSPSKTGTAKSEQLRGNMCKPAQPIDPTEKYYKDLAKPLNSDSTLNSSDSLMQAYKDTCKNPAMFLEHSKTIEENLAESMLADALLPPSNVNSGDIIGSTLDEKRLMFIREKLMDKYTQENQMVHSAQNVARDLDPYDSPRKGSPSKNLNALLNTEGGRSAIIAAMKNPAGVVAEEKTAGSGKENECKPAKVEREVMKPVSQLAQSIPLDAGAINKSVGREKQSQMKEMAARGSQYPETGVPSNSNELQPTSNESLAYPASDGHQAVISSCTIPSNIIHSEGLQNQIFPHEAVGTGNQVVQNVPNVEHLKAAMEELTTDTFKSQKCHNCEEQIRVGDVAVITEKAKNAAWHPGCFVCSVCNELLADLFYFYYKNKLYCGRDLATLLGIPRCFACDELIFVREYTVAEGHNYHVKHFCCWDCDMPLAGQQYITENDRPLCLPCYQKSYAKTCNACNRVIAADQQGVAIKDLNFHATESCFCCYGCRKNLLNGRMAVKEDKLFCSKECISQFLHPIT